MTYLIKFLNTFISGKPRVFNLHLVQSGDCQKANSKIGDSIAAKAFCLGLYCDMAWFLDRDCEGARLLD